VRTIVSLAKTLGIAVAAEGVEHPGQLERLLELGCDQWQGLLFSPALDAQAFASLSQSARTARSSEA
jgi:diguanylate cyclase